MALESLVTIGSSNGLLPDWCQYLNQRCSVVNWNPKEHPGAIFIKLQIWIIISFRNVTDAMAVHMLVQILVQLDDSRSYQTYVTWNSFKM